MQVILGAGGAIANELAKELKKFTGQIRLVSRNPQRINDDDELLICDLTKPEEVNAAVKGADIAYLTVGLPYKTKVWQRNWPQIMNNTINACIKHKTKLVFFDNIYMYAPDSISLMTEENPVRPISKKGLVRAHIAQTLQQQVEAGKLEALIARSADFYGPGIENSVLIETVLKNFQAGKKANWFCSTKFKHNFTYTPDAAKATALLGNTESAYGQVWHLPTDDAWTGEQWIAAIAREMGIEGKTQVAPKWLVKIMGIFIPIMRELYEMLYQYDQDYNFDSSKFVTVFNKLPTPNAEGVKEMVKHSGIEK